MPDLNEIEILQVAPAHEGRAKALHGRPAVRRAGGPGGALFAFPAGGEERIHLDRIERLQADAR